MAFVVLREGERVEPAALIAWCDQKLPAFMVPRYIEFVTALPQTATEKVRKKDLRERGIGAATWDRVAEGVMLAGETKKIGSTSCRERGCQYVEISVAAVLLTKKHTNY